MLSFPKASGRAVTGETVRLFQDADGDTLRVGRSPARRVLLCVVVLSSLAQEARSLSLGRPVHLRSSPQLPSRSSSGCPAFLTAPRLPQSSSWAAGDPRPVCRRSPRVPHAAPQRVLPVALVSRGITSDPRNSPWTLHASGGLVFHPPSHFPVLHELELSAVVFCNPARAFVLNASVFSPIQVGGRALRPRCRSTMRNGTRNWRSCAASKRPTGARSTSRTATRSGRGSCSGPHSRCDHSPPRDG